VKHRPDDLFQPAFFVLILNQSEQDAALFSL
jgi:hypothetical protein